MAVGSRSNRILSLDSASRKEGSVAIVKRANEPNPPTPAEVVEGSSSRQARGARGSTDVSIRRPFQAERSQTSACTQTPFNEEVSYTATGNPPARTNPIAGIVPGRLGPDQPRRRSGAGHPTTRGRPQQTNPIGSGGDGTRSPGRSGIAVSVLPMRRAGRIALPRVGRRGRASD